MNKKDAHVFKILTELGHINPAPLTESEEYALRYATDADFKNAEDIKNLLDQPQPRETD